MGWKEQGELTPRDEDGKVIESEADLVETWKAMEKLVKTGLVRSIGVSNFNSQQIERILKGASVVPAMNQVRYTPCLMNFLLINFHDIVFCEKDRMPPLSEPTEVD